MERKEHLYAKFDKIPTRKGKGGVYSYIRWQDVADRMNEVFGPKWSSEVVYQDIVGKNVVVRVRVTVPDNGNTVWQEGFGGASNDEWQEAGNPFKAAYSKALKDACKKWGVGLWLDEENESIIPATKPKPHNPQDSKLPEIPQTTNMSTPLINTEMETPPTVNSSPAINAGPNKVDEMPLPPGVAMTHPKVSSTMTIVQEKTVPEAPPINEVPTPPPPASSSLPPTPPTGQTVSLKEDMPMSKVTTINTGEVEYISDVQKAALESILCIKGAEYESLAKEAFQKNNVPSDVIPKKDELTYQQAVFVVKYGNDKFRRR